jgi:hypothetical protein
MYKEIKSRLNFANDIQFIIFSIPDFYLKTKLVEGRGRSLLHGIFPAFTWNGRTKLRKSSIGIVGRSVEIRTRYIMNTSAATSPTC